MSLSSDIAADLQNMRTAASVARANRRNVRVAPCDMEDMASAFEAAVKRVEHAEARVAELEAEVASLRTANQEAERRNFRAGRVHA